MKIEINAAPVRPDTVQYRAIGFGKPQTDQPALNYTVRIDRADFVRLLAPVYDEFVYECEAEDIRAGKPNAPAIIVKHRYLPLARMMAEFPDSVGEIIQRMFIQEFLSALFDDHNDADCRYVLNDIQSFRITPGEVVFSGTSWAINR